MLPPGLTGLTPGSPMIAWLLITATASVLPRTVSMAVRTELPPGGTYTCRVPSLPSVSSMFDSSTRCAISAPACTTTTASTPRNRLTIDNTVRVLRDRMPCSPMISEDR